MLVSPPHHTEGVGPHGITPASTTHHTHHPQDMHSMVVSVLLVFLLVASPHPEYGIPTCSDTDTLVCHPTVYTHRVLLVVVCILGSLHPYTPHTPPHSRISSR